MNKKQLTIFSYLFLIIPVILFFVSYLKLYFSIPLCIGVLIILYKIINESYEKENIISKKRLITITIFSLILCITAGIGGLYYQSNDWHWRNAIYRDMINKPWPIYYPKSNSTMNYYIGFWIVPAVIAKLFLGFGQNIAWIIGNILLLIYALFGVLITILWIINTFKLKEKKKIIISILIFIFFSGLDIIGVIINNRFELLNIMHLEWWANSFQFSSIITQIFWVFNQSIVAWIITWMYLNEKKLNNFFLLIILALPYSPLPFFGLMILFFASGLSKLIESIKFKKIKELFLDIFSLQNVLALICIFPIYYLFYKSNDSLSDDGFSLTKDLFNLRGIIKIFGFWFLEIGVYYFLMFKKNKKNYLFHVAFLSLIFIPIIRVGTSCDFSMRASIPLIVVCIYFIIDYLINYKKNILIIIVLLIGAVTPFVEYKRSVVNIVENKKIDLRADKIKTFENEDIKDIKNFVSKNPEKSIFYKYLTKNIKGVKNGK